MQEGNKGCRQEILQAPVALIWLRREPIFLYSLLLQSKIRDSGLLASNCQPEGWSKSVLFILLSLLFVGGGVETSKLPAWEWGYLARDN